MEGKVYDKKYLNLITASIRKPNDRKGYVVKYRLKNSAGEVIKQSSKGSFATLREAKEWIEETRAKHAEEMYKADHPTETMTFLELYEKYRLYRIGDKLSTKIDRESIVASRILPFFADKLISDITLDTIVQWHSCFYETDGTPIFKETYLRTLHAKLSAILNYAVKCGWLKTNPASSCSVGSKNAPERPVWTLEEYSKFRKEIQWDVDYLCAFDTLYFTGLRKGELFALTIADIDFEKKTLSVTKSLQWLKGIEVVTTPKTKKSIRTFRISQMLVNELRAYIERKENPKPSDRIFPITSNQLANALIHGTKKAGLPPIPVHSFRHSHITNLIAEGYSPVDVAKRVGHESIYITLHYTHAFKDVEDDIANSLDEEMLSLEETNIQSLFSD